MPPDLAELLGRALAAHLYDGTEAHGDIDRDLRGLEHAAAAAAIKIALKAKYSNTIPVDAAIEVFIRLLENGELT